MEDCFEGVICFETLNPPPLEQIVDDNKGATPAAESTNNTTSRILCKPAVEAMEAAIMIANADPMKTVTKTQILDPLTLLKCTDS